MHVTSTIIPGNRQDWKQARLISLAKLLMHSQSMHSLVLSLARRHCIVETDGWYANSFVTFLSEIYRLVGQCINAAGHNGWVVHET